jgi:hypothetical protein
VADELSRGEKVTRLRLARCSRAILSPNTRQRAFLVLK